MQGENIYVIGGNHHNTLGVIRSLGYRGIYSNLILVCENKRPYISFSKYIKEIYKVKTDKEAIDLLKSFCHKTKAVLIACSDGASSEIDLNKDYLSNFYHLPGCNIQGKLSQLMNKETMSNLASSVGLKVPKSWVVENVDDINNFDIQYPCIIKPIISKYGKKTDVQVCFHKEDLLKAINNGSCFRYQVQQYIDKIFEYQLIGLSLDYGKEIIIPGFSRCIRPCPRTNTGYLHYEPLEEISAPIENCKRFLSSVGYSGLFSIEFLRDKQGVDYFMETNFRNDGNAICVTASGTNLSYIWYLYCTKQDYKEELNSSKFKAVYVMPEFADFSCFVKSGKISIFQWIRDLIRTNKFMEFDRFDKKPFYYYLLNKILNIF